jgi:hypothetical protein
MAMMASSSVSKTSGQEELEAIATSLSISE